MKKLIVSFLTLLSLTIVANAVFAEVGKITANATKSKYVSPDTATISFTIETQDKNSQKAVEENNKKVKTLVEVLKQQLAENETIKTSNYNLSQNYEYNSVLKKNIHNGYIVTNTLTVTLKDTAKTGKLIDFAVKNGADRVSNLSFTLQNTDKVCKELTAEAVAKAKNDAMNVLSPLGKKIDAISNISYGCSTYSNFSPYRNFVMKSAGASRDTVAEEGLTIEQGETKVEASVTIVFTIK